jgi:competence protein CoiA
MIYASSNGRQTEAYPGIAGICPLCKEKLAPKCGEIRVWHWAHKKNDCDHWAEPETEWHKAMKALFGPEQREVVIAPHRADVRTRRGRVIEFQHSSISPAEIREREEFYGPRMTWVIDASQWGITYTRQDSGFLEVRWPRPRKAWLDAQREAVLDLGYVCLLMDLDSHSFDTGNWGAQRIERKDLFAYLIEWEGER